MTSRQRTHVAGAPPADRARIDVRVGELRQLFNSMDPSPFRERDLDTHAEQYIVDSARDLPRKLPFRLVVHLTGSADRPEHLEAVPRAVREHFTARAGASRSRLRRLLGVGWVSLLIGLGFVAAANLLGEAVGTMVGRYTTLGRFIHDSVVIGSWVALWRPLEIFLYDWWPLLGEIRLLDRLGAMQVEVVRE